MKFKKLFHFPLLVNIFCEVEITSSLDVVMDFAKAYKVEITLAYYCFNLSLTIAIFIFGTIYLRHRDRRDQQRKEWREFAKAIRGEYSTLKDKQVLSGVSKTNEKFGNVVICPGITGLDVLRYMLNNSDFQPGSTWPRSSLCELRENLDSIFQLLNTCASLTLLGPVPSNIRAELGRLVTDLGEMTLPFFSGDQRQTVLTCLKYFSSDRKPAMKTEKRLRVVDRRILKEVPYIKCLRFGKGRRSSEINKFTFEVDLVLVPAHPLNVLNQLQWSLEEEKYFSEFAREFREHFNIPKYIDKIDSDSDELVIAKVLHEVRVYVHLLGLGKGAIDEGVSRNIEILSEVYERVTKVKPEEEVVRYTCERFIQDLSNLKKSKYSYHSCASFREGLTELYERFCNLIIIRKNVSDSSPPPTSTKVETRDTDAIYNCQYESYV